MNAAAQRRPLRAGTELDYCGMSAIVVADHGGETLTVACEGFVQPWRWTFEGVSCTVVKEPEGRLFYETYDDYVKDFPEGERARAWLTNQGRNEVWMFRLTDTDPDGCWASPHGGLPGNFMAVTLYRNSDYIRLAAHDCDDGLMVRDFPPDQEAQARQVLKDMAQLTPFSMYDAAKVFNFQWE